MKSNKCIISLATKNSRYVDGLARLSNSLRDNAAGIDFLGFIHEHSVGAPLHVEHPYAFKIHAIKRAIQEGYDQILWLDVSVWAVAPVESIFNLIEQDGYFFTENGCLLGNWTNDKTLNFYGLNRDEAMGITMMQAGFMGFNMNTKGGLLIKQLETAYLNYLFYGGWNNEGRTESLDSRCMGHRHEQSCLSAILYLEQAKIHKPGQFIQYGGIYDQIINETIVLKCQGI